MGKAQKCQAVLPGHTPGVAGGEAGKGAEAGHLSTFPAPGPEVVTSILRALQYIPKDAALFFSFFFLITKATDVPRKKVKTSEK